MYACTSPVCFNARCITLCVWLISEHCANCSLIYRDTQYIVIQTYNNRDTYFPISWQHYCYTKLYASWSVDNRCYVYIMILSLDDHETLISKSYFVVERIQSLSIISEDSDIRQVLSRLQIPRRNIPAGQQPEIYFSVLLAGPFSVPEDCHIVSSILYINYHNIQKKQLEFRLNHWYAGKNRQKTMTFLKSPSVLNESSVYPFEKHSHGSFSDDEQLAVLSLDVDPCLLCVAVEKTGNLLYPVNCSLQLLKKTQTSCITAFRLYVTYTHDSWTKVCLLI